MLGNFGSLVRDFILSFISSDCGCLIFVVVNYLLKH